MGELRLSGNHTVTEYEMSGKPYSQKSGLKNHTNGRIFQVMTWYDQLITPSVRHIVILPHIILLYVAPLEVGF